MAGVLVVLWKERCRAAWKKSRVSSTPPRPAPTSTRPGPSPTWMHHTRRIPIDSSRRALSNGGTLDPVQCELRELVKNVNFDQTVEQEVGEKWSTFKNILDLRTHPANTTATGVRQAHKPYRWDARDELCRMVYVSCAWHCWQAQTYPRLFFTSRISRRRRPSRTSRTHHQDGLGELYRTVPVSMCSDQK